MTDSLRRCVTVLADEPWRIKVGPCVRRYSDESKVWCRATLDWTDSECEEFLDRKGVDVSSKEATRLVRKYVPDGTPIHPACLLPW